VGDWVHGLVQGNIYFHLRRKYTGVWVIPELRSQTRKTRLRLPDVTVTLVPPQARYLVDAAFLAVEVLSEDDPMSKVIEKLEEYSEKGVANIWLIDPRLEKMFIYRAHALEEVQAVIATENPRMELTREEVFRY